MDDSTSIGSRVTIEGLTSSREDSSILLLTSGLLEVKKELTEVRKAMLRLDTDVGNVFSYLKDLEAKFVAAGLLKGANASY
jgi:hypothetical protein